MMEALSKEVTDISTTPQRAQNLRANVRHSILNGSFGAVATGIVSTFVPLYMIDALHATNQLIGWLNSLPALTGLAASLIGAIWIPRLTAYRLFSVLNFLAARMSYVLLAFLPLLTPYAAASVVGVNAAANLPQTLGTLGWQGLMAKLIPATLRESFFGRRNAVITIVGLVGTVLTGGVLQFFNPRQKGPYQAFFVLAFLLGLAEVLYLLRHRESITGERPAPLRWNTWADLWKVAEFRRYLMMSAFFNFGWQLSWPLFSIYLVKTAHATGLWIGLFTIATQATEIVTFRVWGRWARQRGGLTALGISALGVSLVPVLTVLSTNMWYLVGVNLFSGLFLSGVTLLLFTELLNASPAQERSSAIAFYNVALGAVAFLAPEFGVQLMKLVGLNETMLVSTLWRLCGSFLFLVPLWWAAVRRRYESQSFR